MSLRNEKIFLLYLNNVLLALDKTPHKYIFYFRGKIEIFYLLFCLERMIFSIRRIVILTPAPEAP